MSERDYNVIAHVLDDWGAYDVAGAHESPPWTCARVLATSAADALALHLRAWSWTFGNARPRLVIGEYDALIIDERSWRPGGILEDGALVMLTAEPSARVRP